MMKKRLKKDFLNWSVYVCLCVSACLCVRSSKLRERYYNHHHIHQQEHHPDDDANDDDVDVSKWGICRATKIYLCVFMATTLFLTVGFVFHPSHLKTTRWWQNFQWREEVVGCFWQARFLASLLKLIRSKVWAHKLQLENAFKLVFLFFRSSLASETELTCVRPFSSSHFSAALLGTCFKSICGQAPIGSLKRSKLLMNLESKLLSFLTVNNFLLGLVDLLPHLPEYLLFHHLQVPRAPVPVHHCVRFWGKSSS